uniref:Uncharacterized protein n=1 Tax=Arundo donax TaxID=35708 RepID=A0A0A9G111_ARUDO
MARDPDRLSLRLKTEAHIGLCAHGTVTHRDLQLPFVEIPLLTLILFITL